MDIKEYLRNVTTVEIEKVCELAGTTYGYLKLFKGNWAMPSVKLQKRLIDAALEITPDRIPEFSKYAAERGMRCKVYTREIETYQLIDEDH